MSVWVVAASKYGSTREVADVIAEELGGAEVHDAAEVEGFDGAIRTWARSIAGERNRR